MSQRSRFARLSIQLSDVNQFQLNQDIEGDASINEETKQYLKQVVEQSTIKKDEVQENTNQESSPLVKSPMKLRRGNSLILLKNLDIMRIKKAEDEGYLKKSRFSTQKQFDERKTKLNEALKQKEKIDMKDNYMQNLAVEISVKAIKTYNEAQFLLKIFIENTIFQKYSTIIRKNRNFINLMSYKFYPKNSVIYETGDFAQDYYFLLSGKLFQLLPSNEEIVNSPIKLTNSRHPNRQELHLLNIIRCQEGMTPTRQQKAREFKNSPLINSSHNASFSMIVEKDFQQYVPHHKFNQYILPGQDFGDSELLSRARRGCTIFCDEDSHLITITKETFDQVMGEEKNQLINQKILFFKQFEFLEGIPNTRLIQIIDTSITIHLNSKNILYSEGQECDSLYFIRKGEMSLVQLLDPNGQEVQESENQPFLDELDLHKAMNKRKKKQERATILILGENSYFGDYEILKKFPFRMTQAICTSQECEIIEVKSQKLFHLIKTFGKYQNLTQNEQVRDEFMKQRLQLIQNQKKEQIRNRLIADYTVQEQPQTQNQQKKGYIMSSDRRQQLQQPQQPYQTLNSQVTTQPIIFKNGNMPIRRKTQTLSFDFEGQGISLQKSYQQTYSPATSRKYLPFPSQKIEELSLNNQNNSPSSSIFAAQSERNITLNSQANLELRSQYQQLKKLQSNQGIQYGSLQGSPQSQRQYTYDFSIKETKSQVLDEILIKNMNQIQQTQQQQHQSLQQIPEQSPQQQQQHQQIQQPYQTPQQIKRKNFIHRKCNSSTQIYLPQPNEQTISNSKQELINLKNDIQKNLFQTFVENAEKQILQKQAIVNKLTQNNQQMKKNGDKTKPPTLFEDEFMKGFNQMYLRKFGKKFEKK